jgi:hypothetical protein
MIKMSGFGLVVAAAITCWAGGALVGCDEAECPTLSEAREGYCVPQGNCRGPSEPALCKDGVWTCPPGKEVAGLCPVQVDAGPPGGGTSPGSQIHPGDGVRSPAPIGR